MWNYKKISNHLLEYGYYEFKNYLSKKDVNTVKETLLNSLNYIKKIYEKNLQKKY